MTTQNEEGQASAITNHELIAPLALEENPW
ncbi:hypothetical protein J3D46_004156 [Paenarthrobacter sp. A20]|nr:hypothetical protein [Paenarthrobacter sp. A20]